MHDEDNNRYTLIGLLIILLGFFSHTLLTDKNNAISFRTIMIFLQTDFPGKTIGKFTLDS